MEHPPKITIESNAKLILIPTEILNTPCLWLVGFLLTLRGERDTFIDLTPEKKEKSQNDQNYPEHREDNERMGRTEREIKLLLF